MLFGFCKPAPTTDGTPPNEARLLDPRPRRLALAACAAGGLLIKDTAALNAVQNVEPLIQ